MITMERIKISRKMEKAKAFKATEDDFLIG
jgi:hypothetical protein